MTRGGLLGRQIVRRRLFWKIYVTLLLSLFAATVAMGTFWWLLGEAQRPSVVQPSSRAGDPRSGGGDVSLFDGEGHRLAVRGEPISLADYHTGARHGPGRILRIELPDDRFILTRFGPSTGERALRILTAMLSVLGAVGLAAYPVTALLTRRLEALRAGVARWGLGGAPLDLDTSGSDEVASLAGTFKAAARSLDGLVASQKALLANASHELRSPLARLRVAVEIWRGQPDAAAGAATEAEIIRNLAEMDGLVEELLLSSRLDHAPTRREGSDRVDLLGLAAEEAARYEAVVSGEPVEITGDAVLLRRLIRNLLDNGARHGRPPLDVAVSLCEGQARISVCDGGPGIAAAERERIFDPFYRPRHRGEDAGGWGLGLALVRQIAERHGGHVACREMPTGGSRFDVTLSTGGAASA